MASWIRLAQISSPGHFFFWRWSYIYQGVGRIVSQSRSASSIDTSVSLLWTNKRVTPPPPVRLVFMYRNEAQRFAYVPLLDLFSTAQWIRRCRGHENVSELKKTMDVQGNSQQYFKVQAFNWINPAPGWNPFYVCSVAPLWVLVPVYTCCQTYKGGINPQNGSPGHRVSVQHIWRKLLPSFRAIEAARCQKVFGANPC